MTIGTVVRTPAVMGFVDHVGIVSQVDEHGRPTHVISNSLKLGRVAEESINDFAAEARTWKEDGYLGSRPPEQVLDAARALLGRPYSLFSDNCEHFVRRVHGVPPDSPQVRSALATAGAIAVAAAIQNRR